MPEYCYLVALGSNMRHVGHGAPPAVLRAAFDALDCEPLNRVAKSRIVASAPIGPSQRRYANAVALVATRLDPPELLALLKRIEAQFGRRPGGRRWRARVLDLDLILWSEGPYAAVDLVIPHPEFRHRAFVLKPAVEVATRWRDPLTGLSLAQLTSRLTRPRAIRRAQPSRTHRGSALVQGALSSVGRATDF